jgi:ABC-type amino acid transport substrate-binding protein
MAPDPEIDVVVSLNISAKREATMDLTHAFFNTGLAIAVTPEPQSLLGMIAGVLTQPDFWAAMGLILGALLFVALLMWLIERKKNPEEFGGGRGIVNGFFWAVESLIGYGEASHRTRAGRVLGILWVFLSVMVISGLTAKLSSVLTVQELRYAVSGPADLPRVKVGTVSPSAGARYLDRRRISYTAYPDAAAALAGLARGEVQALVYEAPILQYLTAREYPDRIKVLDGTFDNHGYGFGLRQGSPLREPIDQALLEISASEEWAEHVEQYLGAH